MSNFPSRLDSKAILSPRGDQSGQQSSMFTWLVSCTGFVPSTFITQISIPFVRVLMNAIREPSGDQEAKRSPALTVGVRFVRLEPSALATHTSLARLPHWAAQARRSPAGDQAGSIALKVDPWGNGVWLAPSGVIVISCPPVR